MAVGSVFVDPTVDRAREKVKVHGRTSGGDRWDREVTSAPSSGSRMLLARLKGLG